MNLISPVDTSQDKRFLNSICGNPLLKSKKAVLNNRGKFATRILEVAPISANALKGDNMGAEVYLTKAFGAPGIMFQADWNSDNAFCLTYFQWGPGMWAQRTNL